MEATKTPEKTTEIGHLYRITAAAEEIGVARTTLQSAADRGEITVCRTGCGLPLVDLSDVREWAGQERKRGPKPSGG